MRRVGTAALVVVLGLVGSPVVHAQQVASGAAIHRARSEYEAASFAEATATLRQLLDHGRLTSEELVSALELLALSSRGLGDDASLDVALLLISLVPDGALVLTRAPPSLRARFAHVAERRVEPTVSLELREQTGEASTTLQLAGGVTPPIPHGVVRVHGRVGDGSWEHGEDTLTLRLDADAEVYASLEIAGVVIRESARQRHPAPAAAVAVPDAAVTAPVGDDSAVWWTVGAIGVALAIGAGVAIGVLASQPQSTTTVVVGPT